MATIEGGVELIVQITRQQLVALDACLDGLAYFDKLAGETGRLRFTNREALGSAIDSLRDRESGWADWLGPLGYGSGYGDGDGYGDGEKED